ncbi:uncharacterized protein LOC121366388 [Gigantopelta aegis]|uniref:uncharacterized protein LOC121366388 n=1 Tax=Gigantopelta aegis TaxID=1735272 RepID=UPI001B889E38|nr:uncharacterized protein LOC121366388 [Gigantopelta aegis]
MDKKRNDNFSEDERMTIILTIKERSDIIEDKSNNAAIMRGKNTAWVEVSAEMTATFPNRKSCGIKDYKELWRRMKIKAKKIARDKKVDLVKTGGGEQVCGDVDEETLIILNIIKKDLKVFFNTWDDDSELQPLSAANETPTPTGKQTTQLETEDIEPTIPSDQSQSCSNSSESHSSHQDPLPINQSSDSFDGQIPRHSSQSDTASRGLRRGTKRSSDNSNRAGTEGRTGVMTRAEEAMSYLQVENEAKMKLITLQQEAAAYQAKRKI